jgi:hypothetical protein
MMHMDDIIKAEARLEEAVKQLEEITRNPEE